MKLMLSIALCPAGCNMDGQMHQFDMAGGSFGRAPGNDWVLPDPSRYVSSRHGCIRFENDQFLLIDESTNGIYVNGNALPIGAAQPLILKNDDTLVFGDYRIQVNIEEITNIPPSEFTASADASLNDDTPVAANPIYVDDLDKWLEPATPESESSLPNQASVNISSSPLVQPVDSIDLGLKGEEKDPLALLGAVEQKSDIPQRSSSAPLADLLGDSPAFDQQMMKVPGVIPDDWDDLLGGSVSDQPETELSKPVPSEPVPSEPVQLSSSVVQDEIVEPEPLPDQKSDKTTCLETVSASELENASEKEHAEKQMPVQAPKAPADSLPKAPETLDLSELLATPPEQLQSSLSADIPDQGLADPEVEDEIDSLSESLVPSSTFKETAKEDGAVNEQQNITKNDGADLARVLGLDRLSEAQQNVLNETVANTVKETVAGMMRTLRARSEIKSEFRLNMTTIQSAENNPLKFSVTPEDAIENMFAKEGKAYLSPIDAMNDGFADISDHQVALFDAMKAAYEHILGQFDPNKLAQKFDKTSSKRFLGSGKGKNWDAYIALFEEYREDNETTFKRLFGEVFADAYERRMHSLKMNRSSSIGKNSR